MKKTARNILIMAGVLVVLCLAFLTLWLTKPQAEQPSSSAGSSAASEKILSVEAAEVSGILVENEKGSFRMIPDPAASKEDEVAFTIEGLEKYELNNSLISRTARASLDITAKKELGELSDLTEFGLSGSGEAKITVQCKNGDSQELILGIDAASGAGKYLMKDGSCYVVTSLGSAFLSGKEEFLSTDIYEVADLTKETTNSEGSAVQTKDADALYRIRFTGTNFPEPIEIVQDKKLIGGYRVTSPITAEAGTKWFSDLVTDLKSLSVTQAAAVEVREDQLSEYGLDTPFAQIEFDLNGEKHTLKVSEKDEDGNRFLMADSIDVVYLVAADTVASWAEATLMDLRTSYIWLPNITNVEKLTLTFEGKKNEFFVTRTEDEERSTEANKAYDLYIKGPDGKEIDYSATYQPFYQKLISIAALNVDPIEHGSTPVLTAKFEYFDGREATVIEFYPVEGQDRYAAYLNGGYSGQTRKSSVDRVTELIEKVCANEALKEVKE